MMHRRRKGAVEKSMGNADKRTNIISKYIKSIIARHTFISCKYLVRK